MLTSKKREDCFPTLSQICCSRKEKNFEDGVASINTFTSQPGRFPYSEELAMIEEFSQGTALACASTSNVRSQSCVGDTELERLCLRLGAIYSVEGLI